MTIKRAFLRVFAKIMVFCGIMMGVFFTPAHADDACRNLLDPNTLRFTSGTVARVYDSDGYLLKANQPYTLSTDLGTVYFMNKATGTSLKQAYGKATYTPTEDILVFFQVYNVDGFGGGVKLQLERGDTATVYQPYNPLCATCDGIIKTYESAVGTVAQNGTPTPTNPIEPTFYQQGDMVLRKVGDIADSYDATTGKITRRIGVKVLNGTENWVNPNNRDYYTDFSNKPNGTVSMISTQFSRFMFYMYQNVGFYTADMPDGINSLEDWKDYLADQYANGTPVTVYYPLKTPVEETPASTTYCADAIKIATTAYNNNAFSSVQTALNSAVDTIKDVVANTITQTAAIAQIASDKQTRPSSGCPTGKTCLLVEDMNGEPHWYEIIENIYGLPSGYTALEYIESTGTQYINTGINQVYQQKVSLEFSFTPTELGGYFGGNAYTQYEIKSSFGFAVGINSVAKVVYNGTGSTLYRNGSIVNSYSSWGAGYSNLSIGLFALGMANNSFTNQTKGKLYYAKIWDENDELVRNFVPAKRNSDNVVGMYDTVTNTFYTNAGSGTFVAGNPL